jgi:hypothetical protein
MLGCIQQFNHVNAATVLFFPLCRGFTSLLDRSMALKKPIVASNIIGYRCD